MTGSAADLRQPGATKRALNVREAGQTAHSESRILPYLGVWKG